MVANKTHIIITGGTIDSSYDGTKDTVLPNKHSAIPAFLKSLKLPIAFEYSEVCMKDSRQITPSDLKKILKTVESSACKQIIITHGTYTMTDTARYLEAHLLRKNQIVILTGSMMPLSFAGSDAPFNLGFAIGKLSSLKPGIYVSMNGKILIAEEATKIISKGKFISLFS
jgi:L-asparaginase